MNIVTVAILLVTLAGIAVLLAYKAGQRVIYRLNDSIANTKSPIEALSSSRHQAQDTVRTVELVDSTGFVVMNAGEISAIPFSARRIDSSSNEIDALGQVVYDFLKGGLSMPGKTIRLVFKPEIAQGLKDGTYTLMQTKTGEVLADAVGSTGKVVGKGRVVQAGQARQLAAGAFQLVSIAVAQAHLADIERSLGSIKSGLSELIDRLESTDQSNISGAIAYLAEIAQSMKDAQRPVEVSSEKSQVIEFVNHNGFAWRDKVQGDLIDLTKRIKEFSDKDTFGTGDTHKELLGLVQKVSPLLVRYALLLQLAAVTSMLVAYLDPAGRKYTRVRPEVEVWIKLVETFKEEAVGKTAALLGQSRVTSNELLSYRREEISRLAGELETDARLQTSNFVLLMQRLDNSTRQLGHCSGEVSLALRYDEDGRVQDAAFIE